MFLTNIEQSAEELVLSRVKCQWTAVLYKWRHPHHIHSPENMQPCAVWLPLKPIFSMGKAGWLVENLFTKFLMKIESLLSLMRAITYFFSLPLTYRQHILFGCNGYCLGCCYCMYCTFTNLHIHYLCCCTSRIKRQWPYNTCTKKGRGEETWWLELPDLATTSDWPEIRDGSWWARMTLFPL